MRSRRSTLRIHTTMGVVETERHGQERRPDSPRRAAATAPVTETMATTIVCARTDVPVADLIRTMTNERLGCVPIVDEQERPIGMITKLDLVEWFQNPAGTLAGDVMMPIAITLDASATVAHAASIMACEDMHHVMIVSERALIGLVSTMDVTRWLAGQKTE